MDTGATAPRISGIHHITAIASDPQQNIDFYTRFLGMRLVKRTVNFDDPGTYHFYYGDEAGRPGTILTFFPWPGARRGRQGTGQVTTTSFAIHRESLHYWRDRAKTFGVEITSETERFGHRVIGFSDNDGLWLELVASLPQPPEVPWPGSVVPADCAIAGFDSATLAEAGYESTAVLLTEKLGFLLTGQDGSSFRYQAGSGEPASTVYLQCTPGLQRGAGGAGTVHHIAWRTPDDESQRQWRTALVESNYDVTPVLDRNYFRSIYFREPGGVLFEIATDPPGFAIDESPDELGKALKLPAQYEPLRSRIEQVLPAIQVS